MKGYDYKVKITTEQLKFTSLYLPMFLILLVFFFNKKELE